MRVSKGPSSALKQQRQWETVPVRQIYWQATDQPEREDPHVSSRATQRKLARPSVLPLRSFEVESSKVDDDDSADSDDDSDEEEEEDDDDDEDDAAKRRERHGLTYSALLST
ncbi:hypothetical protein GTR04_2801 [Trichophyton interdigitale]|uniref:Uncharacterized protein n=1 Tax=Trichophyton interdigitale TaxID=101480 RepID=A0A9P4YHE4_9EURO|nr:hypothetical protein GY631_2622 [Trichophyton interdigitale]KAF3897500.1 hypothetical protein GY632_2255 [Trichophyton interdigitale]KAG8209824.1 hypothetical protein GTR04_2801 [Trichophyton interdigitale]